ncbi:MAG: dihydrolipoamide acyltransferase [Clostridia bacterium]|nr:dihydrolipoamide acyltransferase [Clostridia bacterium]
MTQLIGTSHTETIVVDERDLAVAVGSGDLPVLATPRMAALMEQAAAALVSPHLDEGITTVGISLNITHTAPTLPGATVSATATLTATDGRRFSFDVTAFDGVGEIGKGTHDRVSVKADRFLEKAAERRQDK